MRIIVISDTHGNSRILETILQRHADADACIHLGDGERENALFLRNHPEWQGKFFSVRGNCDFDSELPLERVLELIPGHRIFATHGNRYAVNYTTELLLQEAAEQNCDIVLYGHTHIRHQEYLDGRYLLNPGSASQPRDGMPPSYAYIDYEKGGLFLTHVSLP